MCGFFMSASFVGGRFSSGDRATPRSESRRSFGNGPDGRKLAAAYTYNRGRRWLNPMAISCWMVPADTAMSSMVHRLVALGADDGHLIANLRVQTRLRAVGAHVHFEHALIHADVAHLMAAAPVQQEVRAT